MRTPFMSEYGEVLAEYTRAQAIEDGVLVDVSKMAGEAGIKYPAAVTRRVWYEVVTPPKSARENGETEEGRLWDILWMFRCAARRRRGACVRFPVAVTREDGQRRSAILKAVCGPGDDFEPVITIMMADED